LPKIIKMKILDALKWRYATKEFDSAKKLSENQVQNLLEVLNLTPTSYGLQPLKFVRVKDINLRTQLLEASWNQKQIIEASDLIIICIEAEIKEKHVDTYIDLICKTREFDPNLPRFNSFKKMLMNVVEMPKEEYQTWAKKQAYIALGNLMTAAASEKIDICPMEGFDPKRYDEILNLQTHNLHSVLACPIGFRSDNDALAKLPKVRKKHADIVLEF